MKISRFCLGACLSLVLLLSTTVVSTGRGTSDVDPRLPLNSFTATFDDDPGLPADHFSLVLGGVSFDFTFTGEGDGGNGQGFSYSPQNGEGDSPSLNLQSNVYDSLSIERVTIRRSDGYDFSLGSIFLRNTGGERVFVAAYDDGLQIGSRQSVGNGASATLDLAGSIADELRLWSASFSHTYVDSFAGDTRAAKDFGDLPASYGLTTAANGGANHLIEGPFLGHCVDSEVDGQPSEDASGDDSDGSGYTSGSCSQVNADDDGVTIASAWRDGAAGAAVGVTVNGGDSCLSAWLDWDGDDDFSGEDEHVLDRVPLSGGDHVLTLNVPPGTFDGGSTRTSFFARFRLVPDEGIAGDCSDDPSLSPAGRASGGEVEDYRWTFSPTTVGIRRLSAQGRFPAWGIIAVAVLMVVGTGLLLSSLRRG